MILVACEQTELCHTSVKQRVFDIHVLHCKYLKPRAKVKKKLTLHSVNDKSDKCSLKQTSYPKHVSPPSQMSGDVVITYGLQQ
jgi:hypothetical protein